MSAALFWLGVLALAIQTSTVGAGERTSRVGLLSNATQETGAGWRNTLLQVLGQNGYSAGKNLELIDRYSEGYRERLPQLAREIADTGVNVILTISLPAAQAALAATTNTPIVTAGNDPVENGFAQSYAHPGGRVTGIAFQTSEGDSKRLQLLREAMPEAHHFGYLGMAYQAATPLPTQMEGAAGRLHIKLTARWINGPADYQMVFGEMKKLRVSGVVIGANQPLAADADRVSASAAAQELPTICEWEYMAHAGCALSYGHDLRYAHRRAAEYVARILGGTAAADLPVERSDAWRLVVNRQVSERLHLKIPSAILTRADEVIE